MIKIALSDETLIAEIVYQDAYIDVKQFGAYCDNEHDDTNAIQKAIDYLTSKKAIEIANKYENIYHVHI